MNRITVLIADDLPLLVDALTDLLGGDPSIAVVERTPDMAEHRDRHRCVEISWPRST